LSAGHGAEEDLLAVADTRFRSNAPRIVDETIEGDTLIMDMVNGNYFSCVGASSVAWIALNQGASLSEVALLLSSTYAISAAEAEGDLHRFVGALLGDEVVVAREESLDPAKAALPIELAAHGNGYEPLRLEKHTDLADLILLDPVHDVSVAGWPSEHE
jgi:coenzyme PQQ synthesis protein D (PqqD)